MRRLLPIIGLLVLSGCGHTDDQFVAAVKDLRPSVVLLTMKAPSDDPKDNGALVDVYATGFVVRSGAWGSDILTVQHAIDGASGLRVTIDNNVKRKATAKIVAQNKDLDIALLRTPRANLPVAKLGDSSLLQAGQQIGEIGYPIPDQFTDEGLGLATSVDSGRISSMRKHAIEVNMPIVPGESGGPVFAVDERSIVGIAESRFDAERSIGFALPINDAKPFIKKYER
ncbi:MAG: serine protease [Candidatus Baltobacteraceae bacterium]